jgi:hypothetical protein
MKPEIEPIPLGRTGGTRRLIMEAMTRISFAGLVAAGLTVFGSAVALAHSPLTDGQLDRITAGLAAAVMGSADAQAIGALSIAGTATNSFLVSSASPYPGQPDLGSSGAVVDGNAVAMGNNLGLQGQPPASSTTNVATAGTANGNLVINYTRNYTVTGGGGVTAQFGLTVVYGAWVGF